MENRETVEDFRRRFGQVGQLLVPCYFDPWDVRSGAVLKATIPGWEVFHSVFWPAACVAAGIALCAVFCRRCQQQAAAAVAGATALEPAVGDGGVEGDLTGDDGHKVSPGGVTVADTAQDINSYVVATRALMAQKQRKQRSVRNLWMMQPNV